MNLEQAFDSLVSNWGQQTKEFQHKYRSQRSKWLSGKDYVGEKIMRKMLTEAGFLEEWKKT